MRTSAGMRNRRCVREAEEALFGVLLTMFFGQLNEDNMSDEEYVQLISRTRENIATSVQAGALFLTYMFKNFTLGSQMLLVCPRHQALSSLRNKPL